MQRKYKNKIYNLTKNVYLFFYAIINLNSLFLLGVSTVIQKNDENRINSQKTFYVRSLIKKSDIFKNSVFNKKLHVSKFSLFTKKRHKEALAIRKYRMTGPSTARRHHGLDGRKRINKVTMLPHKEIKLPVRRCLILGKMDNWNARKISKSGVKTHRKQRVNLRRKRIYFEEEDRFVKMRVSTRGLKTIKKYGLGYCCKKFNIDLSKKKYDAGYSPRRRKKKSDEFSSAQNDALNQKPLQVYEDANEMLKNLNLDKMKKE
ncbi:50S ribosomal protein L28, apicoplast [Plasmodium gonderi]|uniref:Large ribosomal subunit protein bL28c n=1 Tax=Plasmodium gonderi TaxID=77519 RepID=A0A1Y1JJE3_PLAGO|nr:50S ribosomal protein L28, apicoplast [Plasmodium gonderi]GAW81535.1 50S ribosomal protein L28, apicoplast [Plasmodium gonderi]